MRRPFAAAAAVALLSLFCSAAGGVAPFDTAARRLMTPAGFRSGDFNMLINFRAEIPKSLSAVEELLRNPRAVDSLVPRLRASIAADSTYEGRIRSDSLWRWLDAPLPLAARKSTSIRELARALKESLQKYIEPLSPSERVFLRAEVPGLFRPSVEDTLLTPVESEEERLRSQAMTDEVMRLADKLSREKLGESARRMEWLYEALMQDFRKGGAAAVTRDLRSLPKDIPVKIGTSGNDVYKVDQGIVFDPGGDDRYVFPDTVRPGTWLMVIDVDGNDTYVANDSVGAAAGFLSLQILSDLKGDDHYLGADFAFGSAIMGYSHLFDRAGDDLYQARSGSLGFAFRGLGILQDHAGNDTYSAAYLSEGASSSGGFGLLLDEAGNDQYLARPVFPDDLRYRDHFLSLSQGFSTGLSPRYAGGLGVLWDRTGEDTYSVDIFGQGTGYWFGWGLLMDDVGNDKFLAHQYAQGAGVHFAVGTLWDKAGDDLRASKGVSQGCGHDGGFGLLVDEQGNDRNLAADMSTGAGSANGLGIFLDLAGDDIYAMTNPLMTLGHGDMRRDRGSSGFFLDLGGKDAYPVSSPPRARDSAAWREYDGKLRGYGYGLDAN